MSLLCDEAEKIVLLGLYKIQLQIEEYLEDQVVDLRLRLLMMSVWQALGQTHDDLSDNQPLCVV